MSAQKKNTIEDLLNLPADVRADLIRHEIVRRSEPSANHEDPLLAVGTELRSRFRGPRRPDGTGGWWILTNTLVDFGHGEYLCPDLCGWRRTRVQQKPSSHPVREIPDWVCEVTLTTRRKDTTEVPRILHAAGVSWYWRVDVPDQNIIVFEWSEKGYVLMRSLFREDGNVRIPPFDAVELSVGVLLGDDPEE